MYAFSEYESMFFVFVFRRKVIRLGSFEGNVVGHMALDNMQAKHS